MSSRARYILPCAIALVYLYSFPYFEQLKSANELPRVFLTTEIVDHGTFAIDARLDELGSRFDVSTTPDGRHYSNKAPGASLLAVPGYLLLKAGYAVVGGQPSLAVQTWTFRVTAVTLPSLLFLPWFLALARKFAPDKGPRHTALVAYAFGSMALPYGILFFSHQLAAVCAGAAFVAAVKLVHGEARRPDLQAVVVGLLAGLAILTDYQAALAALAVGLYLLLRARKRWRHAALALAGTVPSAVLLASYHWACFGSPLRTGYSFAVDEAHTQGILGIVGPNSEAMWNALLAPDNGLITLSPWVLLALVGGIVIARSAELRQKLGAEALVCSAVVGVYVLFVGSLVPEFGRAGWSVGPRYIVVCLPFCGWLAAAALQHAEAHRTLRTAALVPVLLSVAIYVLATATYPHWPTSFAHPLYELSVRLVRSQMAPHSLATAVGLRGWMAYAPLFVGVAALAGWLIAGRDRRRWVSVAAAAVVAAALFAGYGRLGRSQDASRPWRYIERTWEPSGR